MNCQTLLRIIVGLPLFSLMLGCDVLPPAPTPNGIETGVAGTRISVFQKTAIAATIIAEMPISSSMPTPSLSSVRLSPVPTNTKVFTLTPLPTFTDVVPPPSTPTVGPLRNSPISSAIPSGRIAFSSNGDIYVINADGTGLRNLTNNPDSDYDDYEPAWSPDGRLILFTSQHFTPYHLPAYEVDVMNADGTNRRRFSPQQMGDCAEPTWSPDGHLIAFTQNAHSTASTVVVMDDNGSVRFEISRDIGGKTGHPSQAAWSPDGRYILMASGVPFAFGGGVAIANSDGTNLHIILKDAQMGGFIDHAAWSPDAHSIVFGFIGSGGNIWLADADGANPHPLEHSIGIDPTWSPDGRFIAFVSQDDTFYYDILLFDTNGRVLRVLTHGTTPAWSPR